MAIAWLYRADYARGGQRMLTVVDPTGLRAGAQAVVGALALVPVSLVPALSPQAGSPADLLRLGAGAGRRPGGRRDAVFDAPRRPIGPAAAAGELGLPDLLDGTVGDGGRCSDAQSLIAERD